MILIRPTDLVEKAKVEAIVGAQSLLEATLLAAVSEKAKVPLISSLVPTSLSLNKYSHVLQLTHDSTSEAKGITRLIRDFDWESIVVIYEDVDDWREGLQELVDHFQDNGIHIDRTASFAESGDDYMVMNQLRKLKSSRTAVFVVHMSEILVSRLFRCAEKLEMMEGGYAWILTAGTMNRFQYTDRFASRSMQGVIGFRSYIPDSEEFTSFASRLRKLMFNDENAEMETMHPSVVVGVWAHDTACILATAIETVRLRASENVSDLLETIKHGRFKGLSHGNIQILGNKFLSGTFEIVNKIGTGERRIGLWSFDHFVGRRHVMASSTNELETIIWPGGSGRIPGRRFLAEDGGKKRLRVLVTSRNRFPHLVMVHHDPETGLNTATGFCIEVFKTCVAPFNYELEFIPYDGDNYDDLAYELSTQVLSGAFFILTGFVVWLVERPVNSEFQGTWRQQLGMILWFGFSTLVFAHGEKLQKMSSRFLIIVWTFVVLILTSKYIANLTSTKTISGIQLSPMFTSPAAIGVYRTNILHNFEDIAQALRNGTISYVVAEVPYLSVLVGKYPGVFNMVARESTSNGFGFMFQRCSGLVPNVSGEIEKLRSSGMLKDMERRWFQKTVSSNTDSPANDDASKRLTIQELGGLFIIAGAAHALVLALHLFQTRREILRVLWESRLFTKLQSFSGFDK
ncbi:unnamed protein product [Thlaspi arvense]|uniref:Ionotropic glutamate receptor C-terminal domain-containing protein n=1 Tax=Thlaspi arvense TaxID=13288 RepID=A0AAU9RQL1_THLAR|nr:unnamed protein product [Thlaspi arvense]